MALVAVAYRDRESAGISESGRSRNPDLFFIFTFAAMIGCFVRCAMGVAPPPSEAVAAGTGAHSIPVLRAFSSGCSALTRMEAIANGVPAQKAESKNAATTIA
jgi:hypothetical protein